MKKIIINKKLILENEELKNSAKNLFNKLKDKTNDGINKLKEKSQDFLEKQCTKEKGYNVDGDCGSYNKEVDTNNTSNIDHI